MENRATEPEEEIDPELAMLLKLEQEEAKSEQKRIAQRESGNDIGGKIRRLFGR